jgi:Single-stranded DNA-specific exonuclease
VLANKLLSIYQRPVFVLRKGENSYRGSMRAIGIENFKQYVDKISLCFCGGHENAAGVEIPFENYDKFQTLINQALQNVTFENKIDIDVQLNENQITTSLIQYLKNFNKVTGTAFPPVNVAITNIDDYNVSTMSNGKHLKITTPDISYIQWNYTGDISTLENKCLSFVGSLQVNYFGGKANKQLIIQDLQVIHNE